jgi:hypothetical protein
VTLHKLNGPANQHIPQRGIANGTISLLREVLFGFCVPILSLDYGLPQFLSGVPAVALPAL